MLLKLFPSNLLRAYVPVLVFAHPMKYQAVAQAGSMYLISHALFTQHHVQYQQFHTLTLQLTENVDFELVVVLIPTCLVVSKNMYELLFVPINRRLFQSISKFQVIVFHDANIVMRLLSQLP